MSTEEYITKLRNKLNDLKANNKPLAIAVASTHAQQMERIFVKGQGTSGKIGSYNSSNELYIDPKTAPRNVSTKGKTGKTKFKNGNAHKAAFFKSYKAFRASQGRQTGFVDLKLSGQLQRDISNSLTKISPLVWVTGTKNSHNTDKADGAEDKYGKVFSLTKKERTDFKEILKDELLNALR